MSGACAEGGIADSALASSPSPKPQPTGPKPPFAPLSPNSQPSRSCLKRSRSEGRADGAADECGGGGGKRPSVQWGEECKEWVLEGLGPAPVWGLSSTPAVAAAAAAQDETREAEALLLEKWRAKLIKTAPAVGQRTSVDALQIAGAAAAVEAGAETGDAEDAAGGDGQSRQLDPILALAKIVPAIRNDKKCAKALSLLTKLLEALDESNAQAFFEALALAVADTRKLHLPQFKEPFAVLFTAVGRKIEAFPAQLRADLALWAIAAGCFNRVASVPPSPKDALTAESFAALTAFLGPMLGHLGDALEAKATCAAGPATELHKARLVDVLHIVYDAFGASWMNPQSRSHALALFEKALSLSVPFWASPQGRANRIQLERWLSNMHARR